MPTRKWLLTSITAAVLLPALAVALVPTGSVAGPAGVGVPTVPDRVGEYSHLTGSVSSSPPGRAVALFQHGFGVEFLDVPQAVVVGADGDTVRRVDLAEDRAGGAQGDPAPMLLSPDGVRVAVGDHITSRPDLAVLDLTAGSVDLHPVADGRSVLPLAWSPDGRLLAYLATDAPTNPYGDPIAGDVGLLDLDSGRVTDLPAADVYDPDEHWVTEVPLDGSAPRRLSAVPTSDGRYGVGRFQLATGLLDDLEVREAGAVDRGRWPPGARVGAAVALGAGVAVAAAVLLGAWRRRTTTA